MGAAGMTNAAHADLTLTAAGVADGFNLTVFASGFVDSSGNGTGVGPTGVGFTSDGGVTVNSYATNQVIKFGSDTNGQTVSANGTAYSGLSSPIGAITTGGTVYVVNQGTGTINSLNTDGSPNLGTPVASGLGTLTGAVASPTAGHAFVSSSLGILDINLSTGTYTVFANLSGPDGLSVSPDGSTLFAEGNGVEGTSGHVYGYNISTGAVTFDSGFISTADGSAVAGGTLAGNVFVNTNSGNLYEVNETTLATTLIASGGSRGDIVTVDPNGSLLLSQSTSIVRLSLPAGATFTDAPEPASMALLGVGMAAIGAIRRRKR